MEQRKIGVAIVGCGIIFGSHIQPVTEIEEADLLYLVDIDEDRAKRLAKKYQCAYATDIEQILQDDRVQIVHILTPHYLHYPMAKMAIEAGKHVILEKPVAINMGDALELERLAKKHEKQIVTVLQNRLNPTSIRAKEIITSGKLGTIKGVKASVTWDRDGAYYKQASWRGRWDTEGGGLLINQAIHALDLMQWLGGPMEKLRGHIDTRLLGDYIEVEDTADATIKYKNGATGIFYGTNNYAENSAVEVEVIGKRGKIRLMDYGLWVDEGQGYEAVTHDHETIGGKTYWGNSHGLLIIDAYEDIYQGRKVTIDITEGIKALEIVQGIYQSSRTGAYYTFRD